MYGWTNIQTGQKSTLMKEQFTKKRFSVRSICKLQDDGNQRDHRIRSNASYGLYYRFCKLANYFLDSVFTGNYSPNTGRLLNGQLKIAQRKFSNEGIWKCSIKQRAPLLLKVSMSSCVSFSPLAYLSARHRA